MHYIIVHIEAYLDEKLNTLFDKNAEPKEFLEYLKQWDNGWDSYGLGEETSNAGSSETIHNFPVEGDDGSYNLIINEPLSSATLEWVENIS